MDSLLGLLRVRIIRGVNLAFRDACGSDPYIVLRLGRQVSTITHELIRLDAM
ncbi:hypothetical protein HPP92_001493 [Vanilla planifolia]|uniref:C2 domain-containing protein n=1 Tax=Vanilla planifolia TaxID=51239 RepID=A0A835S7T6_VANPL|nr:hypothetical protein HPP92_001493 [Vanilla planifolia]